MAISFEPIRPRIGVRIHGVDPEHGLSEPDAKEILDLLDRFGVVILPGLGVDDEQQITLAKALGRIVIAYRGDPAKAPAHPELQTISLDPTVTAAAETLKASLLWHIDGTADDIPPMATMLSARVLPDEGAATEFCNTYAAWEELPVDERAEIEDLRVVHSLEASQRRIVPDPSEARLAAWRRIRPRERVLVWTHATGRKSLVLGATAERVVGMEPEAGRALLARLEAWATRPELVHRHAWEPGDVLIWDNRGTMHRAVPYEPTANRVMRRIELEGSEAIA